MNIIKSDYLIIGSGLTGLILALKISSCCNTVNLITKKNIEDSNTKLAQGGIACVMDKNDSFDLHINDTLLTGCGLCNKKIVKKFISEGPERIKELMNLGVKFTKRNELEFDLGLEGGHSRRRILHCKDFTGKELEETLIKKVKKNKNINIYENHIAIDLILDKNGTCRGSYFLDIKKNLLIACESRITVLACGGAGRVYLYTSNPETATGDGIAMAYRAGAKIANMEFVQFHPTCLYNSGYETFLISEAMRGEGGFLRLKNGTRFMQKYHSEMELAPRDIVSKAIVKELKITNDNFVYLDITHKNKSFLRKRFPNIYNKCLSYGIDISKNMIPVIPAAHFFCGGVLVDEHGATSIKNLYAAGETACSKIHGANRLASNSLLECIVYADRIFKTSKQNLNKKYKKILIKNIYKNNNFYHKNINIMSILTKLRELSWKYIGIIRSDNELKYMKNYIENLKNKTNYFLNRAPISSEKIEFRNLILISELITDCAILRKESRGTHLNLNYPFMSKYTKNTIISMNK
ncbi:MAG: L-aspartate oxidase [Endomicrobium sp.]|jgi:L-aspartate oxidase|nr:L-aspartate oxidase [Endomicrobium sp.]